MTFTMGRKWDLTSCNTFSAQTTSFDITTWPRGDHNVANDYSGGAEDCTESQSTCLAEIVAAITYWSGSYGDHSIVHDWYDPYGRYLFQATYSFLGTYLWMVSWMGRFGEINLDLEIYKPGTYKILEKINGGSPITHYFDVYDQTTNKYLHKQGNNDGGTGNSWGAALATFGFAQVALPSSGSPILYVGEGDYSSESGISFPKSQSITPAKATWGGYPNSSDYLEGWTEHSGAELVACVSNPIEMDGTINYWAYYKVHSGVQPTINLKIYRGGNAGTGKRTTSTLVYNSPGVTAPFMGGGWKVFALPAPVSVLRGDIVAIQTSEAFQGIGLRSATNPPSGSYLSPCAYVAGAPSNTVIGNNSYVYGGTGYDVMLRVWNATTPFEVVIPRTT